MRERVRRPRRGCVKNRALLGAVGLGLVLLACRENPTGGPPASEQERTLQRLREESAREQRGDPTGQPPASLEPPNAALAGRVGTGTVREELPLPSPARTLQMGPFAIHLLHLSAGHSVPAGRLTLTTEETFLGVALAVQHTGSVPAEMDLSLLSLVDAADAGFTLASDAQRAAGTRPLQREWSAGERKEVTLYFEVPRAALRRGLSLRLPAAAISGAERDTQLPLGATP